MLFKAKALRGYKLNSFSGELGKAKEFYFDDRHWAVRYLVADTGNWLTGKKVLISPYALVAVNIEAENIDINLTKNKLKTVPYWTVTNQFLNNSRRISFHSRCSRKATCTGVH